MEACLIWIKLNVEKLADKKGANLEGSQLHPFREAVDPEGIHQEDHREDPSYLEVALAFLDELLRYTRED